MDTNPYQNVMNPWYLQTMSDMVLTRRKRKDTAKCRPSTCNRRNGNQNLMDHFPDTVAAAAPPAGLSQLAPALSISFGQSITAEGGGMEFHGRYNNIFALTSVADPDPPDPRVFGPPGSGSINQRYGSFYH
jgi:hypothetical protein